jgi:hypothetical protein
MEKEHTITKADLKKMGKKAKQAATGTALAASLFFGGAIASPKDIASPEGPGAQTAIVQTVELPHAAPDFIPVPDDTERKRSLRDRLREKLCSMPLITRLLILLPIWALGFGIVWAISACAGALSIPVLGPVLQFLIGAAAVFGLVLTAQKAVFPETPIKQLLSKKNLTALIVVSCVMGGAGALGSLLWRDRPYITAAIDVLAAGAYLVFFVLRVRKRREKAGPRGRE